MKNNNIKKIYKNIAGELLEAIYLLDVLTDIFDGSGKECTMTSVIRKKIKFSFDNIEKCRKVIHGIK